MGWEGYALWHDFQEKELNVESVLVIHRYFRASEFKAFKI